MLKLIALITMIIDHIGMFWNIEIFRVIGRVSFPIYCFLISKGVKKTKNIRKYIIRLLILAIISQCIWNYIGVNTLNVLFTYFLFTQIMYFIKNKNYTLASVVFMFSLWVSPMLDYGIYGLILLFIFYYIEDLKVRIILMISFITYFYTQGLLAFISMFSLFSILIIDIYDKPKYYKNFKKYNKLFYIAYPLHLIALFEVYKYSLM